MVLRYRPPVHFTKLNYPPLPLRKGGTGLINFTLKALILVIDEPQQKTKKHDDEPADIFPAAVHCPA
ncbi:hypothetical protein EOW52_06385 [Salmonella enterica]|nr:hypothetical protein CHD70_25745 [Salmonella enterica]EAA7570669.1 hypothetical protein [Salmonella enterica]EAS5877848.1 hypothetical protein [Salmonella enterica]EAU6766599.1 hypothetical protein [Salmonella enterica]EAU9936229.1 hypothetical protein [Salmonella enterica]